MAHTIDIRPQHHEAKQIQRRIFILTASSVVAALRSGRKASSRSRKKVLWSCIAYTLSRNRTTADSCCGDSPAGRLEAEPPSPSASSLTWKGHRNFYENASRAAQATSIVSIVIVSSNV